MISANYYIAISARVRGQPMRYFTGFLVDNNTPKNRFDLIIRERRGLEFESKLSRETLARYKILGFAKKEHAKEFGKESVEVFNAGRAPSERYYNFKKMLLGLFAAEVEKRGLEIADIDTRNVQFLTGKAY